MIEIIKSDARGHADHGWLDSYHSFSFADYHNPRRMGFGNLRVINEDRIAPGSGFGTHGHSDMEIISYVLAGELAHQDSLGNGSDKGASGVIRPGDIQRMSAGRGVRHSEFNHAKEQTHFLQIWILPDEEGVEPGYEQKHFGQDSKRGQLQLVASRDGRDGSLTLHADADLRVGLFDADEAATLALSPQRGCYVHLARGELLVNGQALQAGDAMQLSGETQLRLSEGRQAEVLVFDLAL